MSDKPNITYGPSNPHPLSQMRTELVWEGKYDEFGNRREVNVAHLSMPLQRTEAIDWPQSRAKAQGTLFDDARAHADDFRNRLIWGDNRAVIAALLEEFKGAAKLIYIDPPFDIGTDFSLSVAIGDGKETAEKDQSILEMVAYRDMWGKGTNSYLHMLYERLILSRELLSEDGIIFVHIGSNINHLVRVLMDDVFGRDNFLNEIIWKRTHAHSDAKRFGIIHDCLLMYSNSENYSFFRQHKPHDDSYIKSHYGQVDENGRRFRLVTLSAAGPGPARKFGDRVIDPPPGRHWAWGQQRIDEGLKSGKIVFARTGQPNIKQYLDEMDGTVVQSIWDDIPPVNPVSAELLGYATQKPEALLERIINCATSEGDLVVDFFCGSGTTLAVAEKLGRRWIGADLGRFAVHTSRKRLIGVQRELHEQGRRYRSFDVFNLGRYERQWWQRDILKGAEDEHHKVVLRFFRAEPLPHAPSPLIHGRKAAAFVHVDGIDSIFSGEEAKAVALAVKAAGGKQVHCLAWDFEMDIRQTIAGIESELDVKIRLHRIPREIMEKNRTEVPPFFEVALLEAEPVLRNAPKGKTVEIKLKSFLPSLTEVPSKELEALQERAMTSGFDFIDFWAVDFDWAPDKPFNHHWQDYRTRKDRSLKTISDADFSYNKPGKYTACVKVVDVFGCDTSISVEIEV
ncbi:site-specific DNA-methyltransferase [Mesorhizobium microcysteis]|uniref:site-specific DNA-methyltransferase (adenine-specific) n=1 Tax=Neoaquamicrobium microcysteis TaxID=2682781 RepID=A0A5D4H618_9HYPH|nr:site-specific DNA-methyltransferase [Mesorhizobium microcysteis]TYR36067.1 site-specific DNA-methyltransferase [Mesorhizobium microcysteis]